MYEEYSTVPEETFVASLRVKASKQNRNKNKDKTPTST